MTEASGHDAVASVGKSLRILEVVAERGGSSARQLSDALGIPLPTVYRLLQELEQAEYLVHLRDAKKYELGYKLHALGVSLHRQLTVPRPVRAAVDDLHDRAEVAGYFAVYRGADVVLAYVSECPQHPRITPLKFGYHEAAHATAFGKILLAGMSPQRRDRYFGAHPMAPLTAVTMTDRQALERQLDDVALRGVAWERDEFVPGQTCAAVAVRDAAGRIVGAVAVSRDSTAIAGREPAVEHGLRECAARVSQYYRSGAASAG